MKLEPDYDTKCGSLHGTETAYTVEARVNYHQPAQVGKQIFDMRWQRVKFDKSVIGVPAAPASHRATLENGLLCYAAAQALRWWLHANAECDFVICLETRLIKHTVTYSHTATAVSQHDFVGIEDRTSLMPDDGKE
jgi:hypothetical protein